jgi:hypothetical protein
MTGECIRTLVGHDSLVRALALDPASGRLVSASYDKVVKVWDLRTGRTVQQFKHHHLGHIFDVKFDIHRIVRWAYFHDAYAGNDADYTWALVRRTIKGLLFWTLRRTLIRHCLPDITSNPRVRRLLFIFFFARRFFGHIYPFSAFWFDYASRTLKSHLFCHVARHHTVFVFLSLCRLNE